MDLRKPAVQARSKAVILGGLTLLLVWFSQHLDLACPRPLNAGSTALLVPTDRDEVDELLWTGKTRALTISGSKVSSRILEGWRLPDGGGFVQVARPDGVDNWWDMSVTASTEGPVMLLTPAAADDDFSWVWTKRDHWQRVHLPIPRGGPASAVAIQGSTTFAFTKQFIWARTPGQPWRRRGPLETPWGEYHVVHSATDPSGRMVLLARGNGAELFTMDGKCLARIETGTPQSVGFDRGKQCFYVVEPNCALAILPLRGHPLRLVPSADRCSGGALLPSTNNVLLLDMYSNPSVLAATRKIELKSSSPGRGIPSRRDPKTSDLIDQPKKH